MRSLLVSIVLALTFATASGCGSSGGSSNPPTTDRRPTKGDRPAGGGSGSGTNPDPGAAPPTAAPGARFEDPSFVLSATPGGPHALNAAATFEVLLVPRGGYHVNTEYPMKISLTAPAGITAPRAVLQAADAAELTQARARFAVPFTPTTAGDHRMLARVEFAVCTDENCIPDERTLAVVLPARAN